MERPPPSHSAVGHGQGSRTTGRRGRWTARRPGRWRWPPRPRGRRERAAFAAADRGGEGGVEQVPSATGRGDGLDGVSAPHPAPEVFGLGTPTVALGLRGRTAHQRAVLTVPVVDDEGARGPGDAQAGSRGTLPPAAPQVRLHSVAVGQGHKDVVVESVLVVTVVHLGVHPLHRAGQHQSLVDQVAAEVDEGAAARGRSTRLGPEDLEPGFVADHGADFAAVQQRPQREEVGVPPAVLVHRQRTALLLRELDGGTGRGRVECERLVADDGQAQFQRLPHQWDVRGGGRGDGDRLGAGTDQVLQ